MIILWQHIHIAWSQCPEHGAWMVIAWELSMCLSIRKQNYIIRGISIKYVIDFFDKWYLNTDFMTVNILSPDWRDGSVVSEQLFLLLRTRVQYLASKRWFSILYISISRRSDIFSDLYGYKTHTHIPHRYACKQNVHAHKIR